MGSDAAAAARALAADAAAGRLDPASIDEAAFARALALGAVLPPDLAPVDLLIRTGGERRLSNFLLHETAYSELVFLDDLWPDVTPDVIYVALREYAGRERRCGRRGGGGGEVTWCGVVLFFVFTPAHNH